MGKKKKKMGRPKMNPDDRKSFFVKIRFAKAEKLALEKAAQAAGTCVSRYVIMLIKEKGQVKL
jgi:hypothetical protein